VSPAGQNMLVDTGSGGKNGRDADRIVAAAPRSRGETLRPHGACPPATSLTTGRTSNPEDIATLYNTYIGLRENDNQHHGEGGDRIRIEGLPVDIGTASGVPVAKALARWWRCQSPLQELSPDHAR
jgi:hypothetical protein